MRPKTIILGLIMFLVYGGCKNVENKKETYYKIPNGKIFTSRKYAEIKNDISKRGKIVETILSTIEKKDSIIISIKTKFIPNHNPFANAEKFIGQKLPFNKLTDINGESISLQSLNGKPTLINFWFTNCPPCIKEMPELNKIKDDYGDSVNFLAITFESENKVRSFLKKIKFDFIHIVDLKEEIDKIGNESYPMNMFLDKEGIIRFVSGNLIEKDGKGFRIIINELL